MFVAAMLSGMWEGLTIVGSGGALVSNMQSRSMRKNAEDVFKDPVAGKQAERLLNDFLDTGVMGGKPIIAKGGEKFYELGSGGQTRILLKQITDIEGKPAYEIVSIFKKGVQDEVFNYFGIPH
jgi:hypothetical protein